MSKVSFLESTLFSRLWILALLVLVVGLYAMVDVEGLMHEVKSLLSYRSTL